MKVRGIRCMTTNWLKTTALQTVGLLAFALALGTAGCKSNSTANTSAPIADGSDPADVNTVAGGQPAQVLSASSQAPQQATGEQYPEQTAQYPAGQPQSDGSYD